MPVASYLFKLANICCEKCQAQLKLKDFKDQEALVCSSCGHVMPLQKNEGIRLELDKSLARPSEQVKILREASIFRIEKKWFSKKSKYIIGLTVAWNASLAYSAWLSLAEASSLKWVLISSFAFSGILGLGLVYRSAQEIFNITTILIKNNKLVVATMPISTAPVKVYQVADIQRFTLWKPHLGKQHGHPIFTFGVDVSLKNGNVEKLCPASDLNEALYIEKTIEEFLSIEDAPQVDLDAV